MGMNRDLLIGGDQFRVLQKRSPRELWKLATLWAGAGFVVLPLGSCLLPLEIDWAPYLGMGFLLSTILMLGYVLLSMIAVWGGEDKSGGSKKQLPILVAVSGMAVTIWGVCVGGAFLLLHALGDTEQWPIALAVLLLLAGISFTIGTLVHAWTQLLKAPLWLALAVASLLCMPYLAAAHAFWAWAVMDMTDFNYMLFL